MIQVQSLHLNLPMVERPILIDINCEIQRGDFVILLGGNGSGKSSLIKCLNGQYRPTKGSVSFTKTQAKNCLTMTQDARENLFYDLTVQENFQLWEGRKGASSRARETAKDYLATYNRNLADKMQQKVQFLSGGEKQALILALCLRFPPEILFLDEHTSALDPVAAAHILQLTLEQVQKHQVTCVMTTHNLEDALKYGNRLMALKDGRKVFEAQSEEKKDLTRQQLLDSCY